jgi:cystathionine beta-lyase/cystathionine gamma-synthase
VSSSGCESLILPLEIAFESELAWRAKRGLDDNMFRVSIGLEGPEDLMADPEWALDAW